MKGLRIIVDDNIPYIKGRLEGVPEVEEVIYVDQFGFTPEIVKDADAVVIRTRTRCNEALLGGSRVKLVATATIGMDQIDRDWCAKAGIDVRNAPGCNAPGVAQYVWSALLREGFKAGRDKLGIVGCGNVGSIVKAWGERLGAEILVNDPPKEAENPEGSYHSLEEVLSECGAVTLHTPLTRDGEWPSYHLISEEELELMKPGALLINAARGPVVNGDAVKAAAKDGRIRAVIDTWEGEPEIDPELLNVVDYGTFHIAGYSRQGKERATRMALEALEQKFGIKIDKSGLAGAYSEPEGLCEESILRSYDPGHDMMPLREHPEFFDTLRANYYYRDEVK